MAPRNSSSRDPIRMLRPSGFWTVVSTAPVILLIGMLLIPGRSDAQISPLVLEVRGGAWIPTADLQGAQGFSGAASPGASFGVHFALRRGLISFVAGFSEHRFGCDQLECGEVVDFVSTAWDLGLRLNFGSGGIVPWVSLGGSAALVDAHVDTGGAVVTEGSDRAWGYEVGAGVLVPMGGVFAIEPGVRYGRSDPDFATRGELETRYMVVDLALVLTF